MQAAVLFDNASTVDADDLPVGEGLTDDSQRFGVEVGLSVGGTEYGTVDDEEVGVGGRQTVVAVVDGSGHREFLQTVGPSVDGAEGLQLFFHQPQLVVLFVLGVVAAHI